MGTELQQLVLKRGVIKRKQTNFGKFLDPLFELFLHKEELDAISLSQLKVRLEKFESIYSEYEDIQSEIELTCEADKRQEHYEDWDQFENSYSQLVASAKAILEEYCGDKVSEASARVAQMNSRGDIRQGEEEFANIRLPVINLPKFSGDFTNWLEYKDTYESLIHQNNSINDIQKYHYLRASLDGEASKVIESIEFSASNYKTAWELLSSRYNNTRLLVHNHIKSIFEVETVTKESASALRCLNDKLWKHLRALKSLKEPVEHWDSLIIYIVVTKLDRNAAREWEKAKGHNKSVKLKDMQEFLKDRADMLETLSNLSIDSARDNNKNKSQHSYVTKAKSKSSYALVSTSPKKCRLCNNEHPIYFCKDFLGLSVKDRVQKAKDLKLCLNCLNVGHLSQQCNGSSCKRCNKNHNTLLHFESVARQSTDNNGNSSSTSTKIDGTEDKSAVLCSSAKARELKVLLPTAIVGVVDSYGKRHEIRAILDSGSQSNFISSNLAKRLNSKSKAINFSVQGINGSISKIQNICNIAFYSRVDQTSFNLNCLIVDQITDKIPSTRLNIDSFAIPDGIELADPYFHLPNYVDLLIGSGLFWDLILQESVHLGRDMPILRNTKLGWIVAGSVLDSNKCNPSNHCFLQQSDSSSNPTEDVEDISRFWELEECHSRAIACEDDVCEKYFLQNLQKASDGKFVVKLPLKFDEKYLGESKTTAIKRFLSVEKRLQANLEMKRLYTQFMEEYMLLGHMTRSTGKSQPNEYFLPHHGVYKPDNVSTKLRVVFDASCKTNSGWSLNDLQHKGPTIQNDIFDILVRFRFHNFVVCADIQKMYRQIWVNEEDRHLQKIVWRNDPNEKIEEFTLNTITHGTKSAPYIAIRCLKQVSIENRKDFPEEAEIIEQDFYVDDLLTGFNTEDEAIDVCISLKNMLLKAGFPLHKWSSNSSKVVKSFDNRNVNATYIVRDTDNSVKALGIQWESHMDYFSCKIQLGRNEIITKRSVLSAVNKIYDPLGLFSPCIIKAKLFVQSLWCLKVDWDDPLPDSWKVKWNSFYQALGTLGKIKIDRQVSLNNAQSIELHGFSDASQVAYCACVFVKSINDVGEVKCALLCAKTRVAPLKATTVPRLELCGALMLAKLMSRVSNTLSARIKTQFQTFYWCDSTIVLCWLKRNPSDLQTFVSNRIMQIQELTEVDSWKYVSTKDNPADNGTRGLYPIDLMKTKLWWEGPPMLIAKVVNFDTCDLNQVEIPELKRGVVLSVTCNNNEICIIDKFSSLTKLKRVTAYSLRFIHNLRNKQSRLVGELSVEELNNAMFKLAHIAQQDSFKNEIELVKNEQPMKNNKLKSLTPFVDHQGLLRVGGRLLNSDLNYDSKHSILLDGNHSLTKLIFAYEHEKLLHAGPQLLLSTVRQSYWPTKGMWAAKRATRNCLICAKFKPKPLENMMGDLPKDRIRSFYPFEVTGVDYAGPFMLKESGVRTRSKAKLIKAYVCIFVCFASKAVHIELVTDLTTEIFIAALRRFVSRRGKPSIIWSDNGSNFVGAKKELQILSQFLKEQDENIIRFCSVEEIQWKFIPPHSPHFGGLWESAVKSMKHHLKRVINDTLLTFEDMYTLLVQIEAILNSRPLVALSSSPDDFQPITPSHFLIGRPTTAVADPNLLHISATKLSRYQLIQNMQQGFWSRWSKEYLHTLQQKAKWNTKRSSVQLGTLVVMKNESLPPQNWVLGRISELIPGSDGVVRVVKIKTQKGEYMRSITKVCPLIFEGRDSDT